MPIPDPMTMSTMTMPTSPYFILLHDNLVTKKERSLSVISKPKSDVIQVLMGSLWKNTGSVLIPDCDGNVTVHSVQIEHDGAVLHCKLSQLSALSMFQFDILQAVMTCGERMNVFRSLDWVIAENTMISGSYVYYNPSATMKQAMSMTMKSTETDSMLPAMIHYRGTLPGCDGMWFGIELSVPYSDLGDTDGTWRNNRYFTCASNAGVFTTVDRLRICTDGSRFQSTVGGLTNCGSTVDSSTPLQVGDRVVWISDKDIPEMGTTRWIGYLPDKPDGLKAGIEFDNPIGTGRGVYEDTKLKLFTARMNHASIIPLTGLIRASEYHAGSAPSSQRGGSDNDDVSSRVTTRSSQLTTTAGHHPTSLTEETKSIYDRYTSPSDNTQNCSRPAHYSADCHGVKTVAANNNSYQQSHPASFPVDNAGCHDDEVTTSRYQPLAAQARASLSSIAKWLKSKPARHDDVVRLDDVHISTPECHPVNVTRTYSSSCNDNPPCTEAITQDIVSPSSTHLEAAPCLVDRPSRFFDPPRNDSSIKRTAAADLYNSIAAAECTGSVGIGSGDEAAGHQMADDASMYVDKKPLLRSAEPFAVVSPPSSGIVLDNEDGYLQYSSSSRARPQRDRISYASSHAANAHVLSELEQARATCQPASCERTSNDAEMMRDLIYDKPLFVALPPPKEPAPSTINQRTSTISEPSADQKSDEWQTVSNKKKKKQSQSADQKSQLRSADQKSQSRSADQKSRSADQKSQSRSADQKSQSRSTNLQSQPAKSQSRPTRQPFWNTEQHSRSSKNLSRSDEQHSQSTKHMSRSSEQKSRFGEPHSRSTEQQSSEQQSRSSEQQTRSSAQQSWSTEQLLWSTDLQSWVTELPSLGTEWQSCSSEQPSHSTEQQSRSTEHQTSPPMIEMSPDQLGTNLELNSAVEVIGNSHFRYGIIRWLGCIGGTDRSIAGLEMEDESDAFKDGTFGAYRLFKCPPRKSNFYQLNMLKPDGRFVDVDCGISRRESQVFGSIDCSDVAGFIPPPRFLPHGNSPYIGKWHGIQGHHNSCYLDATLFAMYASTTLFDHLLSRPARGSDIEMYDKLQTTLREGIVNPLRRNYYVRADKVLKLRRLLDKLGSVQGLVTEEKDPEEFLTSMLQHGLKADPFIKLSSGQECYLYQLFLEEKDHRLTLPTTEQLLSMSFRQSKIKLAEVPSCLILQMPRFGKKYRLYDRIIPSLSLDITNILLNESAECVVCAEFPTYECPDCVGRAAQSFGSDSRTFCATCCVKYHGHWQRRDHRPVPIHEDAIQRHRLELFAVICIETSHYVAFVKGARGPNSTWLFFDSMSDRIGGVQGYNVPVVHHCPELPGWLYPEAAGRIEITDNRELPERMRRLLCDAYICMYQTPDMP